MNDDLIKLQHFFELDNRLKKEIYNMCPPSDYTDKHSLVRYTDDAYDSIKYIFSELKEVSKDFFEGNKFVIKNVNAFEKVAKHGLAESKLDIDKLRRFYKNYVSDMKSDFLDSVKENCVGYKAFASLSPLGEATTINEIIHFFHSYVLNNDKLLQKAPLISEKMNSHGYPIRLRGINVNCFNELYEKFPFDLDVGYTDMVAVSDDKLIMMVRDRGHALSIEITLEKDKAKIEYFIPKLCNIDMINELPGINKVTIDSVGATGIFEVDKDELKNRLFDFISKVPTDADMRIIRSSVQTM